MTHGSKWVFCGRREPHPAHGVVCPGTGKCGDWQVHDEHLVLTGSLAPFWCAGSRIRLYRERHVTTEEGGGRKLLQTTWADEPLPVLIAQDDAEGHDGAEVVGKIENLHRESGTGWVTGLLTLAREGKMHSPIGLAAEADFDGGEVADVDGVMVATGARLRAVTLGRRPCWDEMEIW